MYVHKRCVPEGAEQDLEKQAHGYCGVCGRQGAIFHVVGTEDSYRTKIQGVTKTITAVGTLTDEDVTFIKTKTNSTDALVFDDIAPVETAPEAELTEKTEAIVEAPTEPVEAVEEAAIPEEKEPEETPPEAESNDLSEELIVNAEATEPPAEAESEPEPVFTEEYLAKLEEARKADIARLEAELAKLKN